MSRRVYLHIGAPKTGTSYVQVRLRLNRRTLAANDVHYPLGPLGLPSSHFKPALEVIRRDWGGALADAEGSWARLMRRVRAEQNERVRQDSGRVEALPVPEE